MADYTKASVEVTDWTALGDTVTNEPSAETAAQTKAGELIVDLVLTIGHIDVNDAAANFVTVHLMKQLDAVATEDWKVHTTTQAGGGQATTEALDAASAAAQKQVKVAATTDWDTGEGERLLLYNVGVPIDSEVVTIDGWADADYYIANENLANSHDAGDGDALYDRLEEITIRVPENVKTYKLTLHNSDDDANYLWRVDEFEVTEIV